MLIDIQTIIIIVISLAVLIKSADVAVGAIARFAKNVGLSEYLIGLLIVAIGTSLPELSTAVTGSVAGFGNLIVGDVVGANIIDMTVVLGLMAIVGRKIKTTSKILGKTMFITMALVILPFVLGYDGHFSRFEGFIMIIAFALYIIRLWNQEGKFGKIKKDVPFKLLYKDMAIFIVSIPILLLAANFLVANSIKVAYALNVPPILIGLTLIALGTTAPEISVEIRSVLKGAKDIGFGDILGSVIVNSSLVLGLAAVIKPISFDIEIFVTAITFMVTAVFIGLLFMRHKEITWQEGIGLILIYVTFLVSQIAV